LSEVFGPAKTLGGAATIKISDTLLDSDTKLLVDVIGKSKVEASKTKESAMVEQRIGPLPSELVEGKIRGCNSSTLTVTPQSWLEVGDIMSRDVASVSPGSTVVSAAEIMSSNNISCIVVSDNGCISGIVTETDVLKKAVANGHDFSMMKIEQIMSSPVRSVDRNLSVMEAGKIMETENIRRLVILDEKQPVGIITQSDMVRVLASYTLSKEVSEIMTSDVAVVSSSESVKAAVGFMASQDISCLVVIDDDSVVGIFTERDLLKRVVAAKRDPARTRMKDVMSSPVVTVPSDCSVLSARRLLEKTSIRRLVVVDDENLCGVITQTDILKAIKNMLEEEEQNYLRLMRESSNCIYNIDLNLNTTYVNPAFMKLLGVSDPDELINKPFLPERFWINPRKRDQLMDQLNIASVEVKELTLKTAGDERLFVTLFSSPTKNIKGQINGSQGVLYDVTAQKELQERTTELRQSEERFRLVAEATSDLIYEWDITTNRLDWFGDIDSALGFESGEFPRTIEAWADRIHPDDRAGLANYMKCLRESVNVIKEEYRIRRKDGTWCYWAEHGMPVLDNEGHPRKWIGACVDITERKEAQKNLEKLNMELESSVRELSRANKQLEEFAHIAAHDLKTPLRGIGTLADWLGMDYADKFDDAGREQVKLLTVRAKQMSVLIDSIQQYSMLGQSNQKEQQVDLNEVLSEVTSIVAPPDNIEITVENELPVLMCEKTQILQIFQNLLSNAVKYMDKPIGQIKVDYTEDDYFWKFSVTDNGPGIDHRHSEKIFKIFQTLSPCDRIESTGIGLSIVKKLVELNNGKVWVESDVGRGSTFFFTLPKQCSDAAAIPANIYDQEKDHLVKASLGRM
jgi:PAS domain S-box-containing protein